MKRNLMISVAVVGMMIGGGTGAVLASHGPDGGCGGAPPRMERGPDGFDGRMAKILKLSDSQQTLIKAIFEARREEVKPFFDKMHESRKMLMQAGETTVFDEALVRTAAAALAKAETELAVSRIKAQTQINALLTAEQREILKLLRPDMEQMAHRGAE